jgi:hypothetical protein
LTRQKATASETNGSVERFARQKVQRLNAIVIGCDSEDSEGSSGQLTAIGYGEGRGVRADCAVVQYEGSVFEDAAHRLS